MLTSNLPSPTPENFSKSFYIPKLLKLILLCVLSLTIKGCVRVCVCHVRSFHNFSAVTD